ncbi:hypothetical protein T069G_01108 [Trichoderma breve]|uniref:Uncharacterized protein n=1 Tax=Trichoderma breve TaxID=2034170 RepID=A0A9W9ED66_9HYPO|nr:hypothetical protein T069G_01108 [Trichoderma breve]KAJ4864578.1 hypothetical protein T069G_01108 [Trichoderma breve]
MRGLSKAATLILAPTAVLTRPLPISSRGVPTESAFSVAVAVDTSGSRDAKTVDQTLVFNLDIQESSEACSQAKVRIDGFLLSQDDNGTGQGTFASQDGHTVTASWNFTCKEHVRRVPWDQDLTVTIISLDGETIPETSFVTSFRQRTPVKVYDVGGDSLVYTTEGHAPTRLDKERVLERIKTLTGLSDVDDETKADIGDIISIETQMRELGEHIKTKQRKVLDKLGIKPPTPAFNFQTFYQTAKLASSTLRGTMEHWLGSVLGIPVECDHHHRHHDHGHGNHHRHPHRPHKETDVVVSMQVDGEGGQRFFYYRDRDDTDSSSTRLTPTPPRRNVTYFPLFAIIFTFHLALFFVLRSIRQRMHSRRARNHSNRVCRRETRSQRRIERQARRNGAHQRTTNFFCSIRDLFQTKRIELNEKTAMLIHEEDTSMEDELASFQEAASVISDLVAVQETTRSREESQPPRFTEDVSPPAYDEVEERFDEKKPDGC